MKQHTKHHTQELRDPALSAMLKATFADDPALTEAPGRTERIMRQVLSSGIQPVRRPSNWAPLGWIFATTAAAVLVLVLSIGIIRLPSGWGPEMRNTIARLEQTKRDIPAINNVPRATQPRQNPEFAENFPTVTANPPATQPLWQPFTLTPQPRLDLSEMAHKANELYDVGLTAHASGNFSDAYKAYQASYDTMPTPNALLATSDVLGILADEELGDNEG